DPARREVADRGRREQALEVRHRVRAEVGPCQRGDREDEDAPRSTRGGERGCVREDDRRDRDERSSGDERAPKTRARDHGAAASGTAGRPHHPIARVTAAYATPHTTRTPTSRPAVARRPAGDTTRTTAHAPSASVPATAVIPGSARGTTTRPVRRLSMTASVTAAIAYAAVWPKPRAATRAAPCVNGTRTAITTTPITALAIPTSAGVRLSPSA